MSHPPDATLVVITESPSLAAGVIDLFEAEGYRVCCARDLAEAEKLVSSAEATGRPILVAASNGHYSACVNGWRSGQLSSLPLIVVGSRDPSLRSRGQLHVVHLPLDVTRFLRLVVSLATREAGPVGEAAEGDREAAVSGLPQDIARGTFAVPRIGA